MKERIVQRNQQLAQKSRKKYKSAFLDHLFLMLESREFSEMICWGEDGTFFKILQPAAFEQMVLPRFYKHSKLSSFIRQLNMYEFHKICRVPDTPEEISYYHPYFQRNRSDLLEKVIRLKKKVRKSTLNENDVIDDLKFPDEMELTSELSKKTVKVSESEFVENSQENHVSCQQLEWLEGEMDKMEEIVKYMVMKYGFEKEDKNNVRKADTIYEEFAQFSKDLSKLLGFDKIDQQ